MAVQSVTPNFDPILAAVRLLAPHLEDQSGIVELRIPNAGRNGTIAGYFTSAEALARAASLLDGRVPAIYITLNAVNRNLLARAANKTVIHAKTTAGDGDILRRIWLPLDFDPKRPSGVSSTDAEHEVALARAREVAEWLAGLGFPEPVLADSGNGAHLLYRIDLPNTPAATDLIRRCIEAVRFRFSDEAVDIDRKIFNAARIWKLYGTLSCKGDSLPERPHRRARILSVPARLAVLSEQTLRTLAAALPEPQDDKAEAGQGAAGRKFDVEAWLVEHNVEVRRSSPYGDGRRWILAACPWNGHTDNSMFIIQHANGAIAAGCSHNSCAGKKWHDLRDAIEGPGWREKAKEAQIAARQAQVEEARKVLESLAEKAKADPGSVFEPAVIGALAVLQVYSPGDYGRVLTGLRGAGKLEFGQLKRAVAAEAAKLQRGRLRVVEPDEPEERPSLAVILPDAPHADQIIPSRHSAWGLSERGVTKFGGFKDTGEQDSITVTTYPIYISHRLEPIGGYDEPIRYRIQWRDRSGRWRSAAVQASQLLDKRGIVKLADHGLPVSSSNAAELVAWLAHIAETWTVITEAVASRNGWSGRGLDTFLLGGRAFRADGASDGIQLLHAQQATEERLRAFVPAGDEALQIAALREAAEQFPRLWCVYAAVAASPLWRWAKQAGLVDLRGIIFEIASHASGRGKSVAVEAGLSLLGNPDALKFPANTTTTGLEVLCGTFADTAIGLEDYQASRHMTKAEAALELAHLIGDGQPRNRANVHLQVRGLPPFHITLLVASEQSLLSLADTTEGIKHRIYSITPPFGEQQDMQARVVGERLRQTVAANHGWAAQKYLPAVVRALSAAESRAVLQEEVKAFAAGLNAMLDEGDNSLYHRATPVIGVMQAALKLLLTSAFGCAEEDARRIAQEAGTTMLQEHMTRAPAVPLAQRILNRLASVFASETSRFVNNEPGRNEAEEAEDLPAPRRPASSYLGAVATAAGVRCVCFFPDKFEQIITDAGWGKKEALEALNAAGLLVKNQPNERTSKIRYRPAGATHSLQAKAYCLPGHVFGIEATPQG